MSLMFPTIYGIALDNVEKDMKIGASGLIMAILGGAVLTPVQGTSLTSMASTCHILFP
jgi:FHS family L-fucose permease-like MFS transporter